jgi:phosphotriesterase-related protein
MRSGETDGIALIHEHLSCDLSSAFGPTYVFRDEEVMVAELRSARSRGVSLVVDSGNSGHGRDPEFLRRISTASEVRVVASTGHYRQGFFPDFVDAQSVEELAEGFVVEISEGIAGTAVRAGAIGEIGMSGEVPTEDERKVFLAAAMAQRETGVPLMTHTAEGLGWRAQLDLLAQGGAQMNRVVIGHMDCLDDGAAHRAIIEAGAWLGFDRINSLRWQTDEVRATRLADLMRSGHADRVVLSQDIASTTRLLKEGAPGYTALLTEFFPRMRAEGLDQDSLEDLCHRNPWRFLLGTNG